MAYPCCDVTKTLLMKLKLIQDGGQFDYSGDNISKSKIDTKIL